ncbi:MAG: ATP-binding protein [Spirochaetia bacterium]|nr:ATP-binding protein [Spirochaetia bacterium]
MYQRNIIQTLYESRRDTPVQLLIGARQSGKSTIAMQIAEEENLPYRTLDEATVLSAASSDPEGFLRGLGDKAIIDEVQRVPELLLAIKYFVDRQREPGRYFLTGSSNLMTLPSVSDSLSGRVEIQKLRPLSQGELAGSSEGFMDALFEKVPEIEGDEDVKKLLRRIITGGYPEAVARSSHSRRTTWFESYVSTVLSRDVREVANIEGLTQLPRLLSLLASRSGALLNYSELSNSTAIPQSTLKRYLGILEKLFLFEPLPAWTSNRGKRLIKSPKVFLNDTGLASFLLGISGERFDQNDIFFGPLLESFVINELRKQCTWARTRCRLYHYRTSSGREVDVVAEASDGRLVGIEVKGRASVKPEHFRGLHALEEDAGERFVRGIILYNGKHTVSFSERMAAVPISALWTIT